MSVAYFNGRFVDSRDPVVPIDERGHQFGDGVYEVIRIYNNKPFMLEEHLDRLYMSAEAIALPFREARESFKAVIFELISRSNLTDLDVYVQITRGMAARNHLFPDCPVSISMTAKPFRSISAELREKGAKTILHPDERWTNCYIKSLNLLPNILAKQKAHEQGCLEAILHRDGKITEGTSSNVFVVKGGRVQTTPLSRHILAGITRMAVQRVAAELGVDFQEKYVDLQELYEADELFITSTTSEIMPVVQVDGKTIGIGEPGPVTRLLQKHYKKRTEGVSGETNQPGNEVIQ
ncbi:D-amino-acid transaminase [Brevibacillus ruminantium]|uniref:D-alanine aminotransferase n=1 Tax=Brevibacillus ruminantium TaxID=2950604 RepID=A0ABY4WIN1_9BACL|nr:D-amino-acid transaminase [Brevibacillus ruminantium]USG67010.1 D-amino-acid transaminase [Brevibacillus ruminantium]